MKQKTKRNLIIFAVTSIVVIAVVAVVLVVVLPNNDEDSTADEPDLAARKTILWGYKCENERCVRYKLDDDNKSQLFGLSYCRAICDATFNALLWPVPRDDSTIRKTPIIVEIDIKSVEFLTENFKKDSRLWDGATTRFNDILMKKKYGKFIAESESSASLVVEVTVDNDAREFTHETNESYEMSFENNKDSITIFIKSTTFYGFRHGLETLSQLIFYDEVHEHFYVQLMSFKDSPKFKHRGLSIDTSRNFHSVETLKRNINAMAMVKMNRFHWHISDSQSFPFLLKSHPDLAIHSAYSMDQVYTPEDVKSIIDYGKTRGVQVYIEIDMPGHVGQGWAYKNLTSCYGHTLDDYCKLSKPCGQLDPSVNEVYKVLEEIFHEIYELHDGEIDMAHLGGDEVFFECWNSSSKLQDMMKLKEWNITEDESFLKVWGYFQEKVNESLERAYGRKVPIFLWRSTLTQMPYLTEFLNKDDIIIEMWTDKNSKEYKEVLENGFKIMISNYDVLYLDCGFGTWVRDAPDWCTPYHTWMHIYENRLKDISGDEYIDQVLGAEASVWSEMISEFELDGRIWPRLSALAERLWSGKFDDFE